MKGFVSYLPQVGGSSSSCHRLDMTLAVAEALNPNKSSHEKFVIFLESNDRNLYAENIPFPSEQFLKLCLSYLSVHPNFYV